MTISSTNRKAGPYAGNDVAVSFPFAFKVFAAADVLVVFTSASNVETILTLTTNYTVSLNSNQDTNPGGTVTLLTALATGEKLTLSSAVANLQPVDLTNNGGFYPAVINKTLDRATIQIQQLAEKVGRALVWPISSASGTLPPPIGNAVIGWNETGTSLINIVLSAGSSLVNLAQAAGSSLIGFIQSGTGAVTRNAQDKMRESVSVLDFGVQYTATYDEVIAKKNRTKIEDLLRDTTKMFVVLPQGENPLYICGSIHPLRDNLTIWQQDGCNIIAYEQNGEVIAGHLFGFVKYANPDTGDFSISGTTKNITYILDGDIQTAYSSTVFGGNYNHNAIAFYDSENCLVVGNGGISKSNHDGINFDGLANNCHVDINYVKDCSTVNIQMIGESSDSFNSVKAKYVYNNLHDDTVNQPTARSCVIVGGNKVLIDIGSIKSTKAYPIINVQTVTEHADISIGSVEGNGSHLVRMYTTKAVTLHDTKYSNIQHVMAVAGTVEIPKSIIMDNVVCIDASVVPTTKLVSLEITPNSFQSLIINACDFYNSGNLTVIADAMTIPYFDITGTRLPATYNYSSTLTPRIKTVNVGANGTTSFSFDSNTRFGVITKVHFGLSPNATPTQVQMASVALVVMGVSGGATYVVNVNSSFAVTVTRSGTTYTFTAPALTKFFYADGEYA